MRNSSTSHVLRDRTDTTGSTFQEEHPLHEEPWDYNRIIPWTVALNKIDFDSNHFRSTNFKYFALENDPDIYSSKKQTKGNLLEGSRALETGGHTYQEVQTALKASADTLTEALNARMQRAITTEKQLRTDFFEEYLEKLEKDAISDEKQIFDRVIKSIGYSHPIEYQMLVDNTELGVPAKIDNNQDIAQMDTVNFWTRAGLNMLEIDDMESFLYKKNGAIDEELIFYLIISSVQFYEALKTNNQLSEIFTRTKALKSRGIKTTSSALGAYGSEQALNILYEDLNEYTNTLLKEGNITETVAGALQDEIQRAFETYFTFDNKGMHLKSAKARKGYEGQLSTSAEQVSRLIREKISDSLKKLQKVYEKENIPSEIVLGGDDIYFVVYANRLPASKLYEAKMEVQSQYLKECEAMGLKAEFFNFLKSDGGQRYRRQLIEKTYETFRKVMIKMKQTEFILDEQRLGQFNIANYMKVSDFYEAGIRYCDQVQIPISKSYEEDLWKSFNASNNNAYVSGLLGELGGLTRINQIMQKKGGLTGAIFSEKSYGESPSDLRYTKAVQDTDSKGNTHSRSIGVNIKHYIKNTEKEFPLYEDKEEIGVSVNKDTIKKYLTWQETETLRFISTNSKLFTETFLTDLTYYYANLHIPEFYRIKSNTGITNVFFMINNVVYPLSYIYANALNQLRTEGWKRDALFNVVVENYQKKLFTYSDINEALERWDDIDFRISQRMMTNGTTVRINTKGLKINLMTLSLF